jgi:V/A-type H+-transporting ATPase subunit F
MKFFCVADEDTVRGFRLAGVEGQAVEGPREAEAAVEAAVRKPNLGVLVLTHEIAAGIRAQVDAIRAERDRPLVVEVPGPEGPMPGRKTLRQFVQEAVGIRIGREESD